MHVPTRQLLPRVAQRVRSRLVDKRQPPLKVDSIDPVGH